MRDPMAFGESYKRAIQEYFREAVARPPEGAAAELVLRSLEGLQRVVRSPLEALLGIQLVQAMARRGAACWDPRGGVRRPEAGEVRLAVLCSNFRVDRFSFDFWIQADRDSVVDRRPAQVTLVECDGAAWHWGSQLDRDRRKGELAAELGWNLFRLPARRILKNPSGCAGEIVNYALDGYVRTAGVLHD